MITAADATVAPQGFTSAAGVKVFNQGMLDFGDLAPSPTPSPAPAPAQAKAKAKAKQTKKPAPAPTPTPRQTQQGPVKMFNQGMLSFDDDFGLAPAPAPAAAPARAPAPAPAADAANIPGYLFVCSSATEGECFQRQLFGLGAGRLQSMQSSITAGSTPVFLLNFKVFNMMNSTLKTDEFVFKMMKFVPTMMNCVLQTMNYALKTMNVPLLQDARGAWRLRIGRFSD